MCNVSAVKWRTLMMLSVKQTPEHGPWSDQLNGKPCWLEKCRFTYKTLLGTPQMALAGVVRNKNRGWY